MRPFQLAQRCGGLALSALLLEKFSRERFERIGLFRRGRELSEALLLAWVEANIQLALRFVATRSRLFERNHGIRTDCELPLLARESIGEVP